MSLLPLVRAVINSGNYTHHLLQHTKKLHILTTQCIFTFPTINGCHFRKQYCLVFIMGTDRVLCEVRTECMLYRPSVYSVIQKVELSSFLVFPLHLSLLPLPLHLYLLVRNLLRGEFRPRQTRQLPRAVDLKGRLLSCQSY